MELQRLCAYNQTRECFLGLEVAAADLSCADLKGMLAKLALKSGEGIWMVPFQEIPETNMLFPLDLVYLDQDCRVIEVVESFPTFHVNPLSPQPASVLALPLHSIYSSQTQAGDQLVLCVAEEMQRRLEPFTSTSGAAGIVQSAALLRGKPLWSGGPGVVEVEKLPGNNHDQPKKMYEMDLIEPGMKEVKPPRSWLERWWSPDPKKAPDPRKAAREAFPNLAAYYWTGSAPKAHRIRDISSSGLYVVTEERWYPGTLILMTIRDTEGGQESIERSIAVHSRAVRWGNDGVGLQFIPQDTAEASTALHPLVSGADRKDLDQFLQQLFQGKG